MTCDDMRERAATIAARALGGAPLDKLLPLRDALFDGIADAIVECNADMIGPLALGYQLDDLTGVGFHFSERFRCVSRALHRTSSLIDRIDAARGPAVTRGAA